MSDKKTETDPLAEREAAVAAKEKELAELELSLMKQIEDRAAELAIREAALDEREAYLDEVESQNQLKRHTSGFDHVAGAMIKIVRIDGKIPRTLTRNGGTYVPERLIDMGGTPCYTVPTEYAQEMLLNFGDRYALLEPAALICRGFNENGGRKEITVDAVKWNGKSWK